LTLKTKSIYDEKEKSDGTRVLVTRYYPRGVKRTHFDLWVRAASPEAVLLKDYKNNVINWREFSRRFKIQLRADADSKKAVLDLIDLLGKNENLTLLCYEKEGQNCHRLILKSVIERAMKKSRERNEASSSGSAEDKKD